MKFHIFRRLALGLLLLAPGMAAMAQSFVTETHTSPDGKYTYNTVTGDPLNTRIYKLANGLSVYLTVNKAEPRIQTNIAVRAGSKNDPADATGLAHYLEHMLFKGTDQYGSLDYAKEKPLLDQIEQLYEVYRKTTDEAERKKLYAQIDALSGEAAKFAIANEYDKMLASMGATGTNAYTSFEQTVYVNDIPANQLEKWLTVEGERFRNPVLRLFHTELEAVYEEKNISLDNDGRETFAQLFAGLFPTHNYGQQTTIGTVEHLKNPSITRIKEYFARYYVPNNMAICLSGDLDPDATIALIDKYFGSYQTKPLKMYIPPREAPLTGPVVKEVTGPDAESVMFAYRFPAVGTHEAHVMTLVDNLLSNSTAGLMDLDLVKQQKVLSASSFTYALADYSAHIFNGRPREGQTLEEVKDLIMAEIEKIKRGEFDASMLEAILNNMEIDRMRGAENNNARTGEFVEAFTTGQDWAAYSSRFEIMRKITKQEIVDFVNANYKDNYVVVYKRSGPRRNVTKVVKPEITPVEVNRESQTEFLKKVINTPSAPSAPLFVDFKTDIKETKLASGIPMFSLKNTENGLFTLYYYFDMGRVNDKKMDMAIKYLPYLGTDQYTADEIAKQFYALGSSFSVTSGLEQSYVYVSGLEKNFEATVKLFEHLLANAKADDAALQNMITGTLKSRTDAKLNRNTINGMMQQFSRYEGNINPYNDILSEADLKALKASELTDKIHQLTSFQHKVLYYGPADPAATAAMLNTYHKISGAPKAPPAEKMYRFRESATNTVYFVNYDMVQANVFWSSKVIPAYNSALAPKVALFNEYFGGGMSGVVFQTIRESKALAYSTYSVFSSPDEKADPYFLIAFVGTQADKIHEAMEGMFDLLNNLPESEVLFNNARTGIKNQIETERIIRTDILFSYIDALDMGLTYDIRKDVYAKAPTMPWSDIKAFHTQYIANRKYTIMITGSKDKIDLNSLNKYGKVVELTLEQIFGY